MSQPCSAFELTGYCPIDIYTKCWQRFNPVAQIVRTFVTIDFSDNETNGSVQCHIFGDASQQRFDFLAGFAPICTVIHQNNTCGGHDLIKFGLCLDVFHVVVQGIGLLWCSFGCSSGRSAVLGRGGGRRPVPNQLPKNATKNDGPPCFGYVGQPLWLRGWLSLLLLLLLLVQDRFSCFLFFQWVFKICQRIVLFGRYDVMCRDD